MNTKKRTSPIAAARAANKASGSDIQKNNTAGQEARKAPARPGKRHVALYLPEKTHWRIKQLAFETRRTVSSLLMEGLDTVLARHGTSIAQIESGE